MKTNCVGMNTILCNVPANEQYGKHEEGDNGPGSSAHSMPALSSPLPRLDSMAPPPSLSFSGSWIQHVSTIEGIFDISQWEWHHDRICASDRRINHTFSGRNVLRCREWSSWGAGWCYDSCGRTAAAAADCCRWSQDSCLPGVQSHPPTVTPSSRQPTIRLYPVNHCTYRSNRLSGLLKAAWKGSVRQKFLKIVCEWRELWLQWIWRCKDGRRRVRLVAATWWSFDSERLPSSASQSVKNTPS